jgi:hypothetical protein
MGQPFPVLGRVIGQLRDRGPAWVWHRARREIAAPTTRLGVACLNARLRLAAWMDHGRSAPAGTPETLYAFLDLQVSAVTYDVIWFVACADLARRRAGARKIHFVVVPGWIDGFREENEIYETVIDREARRWRILNILMPVFQLLPAAAGWSLAGSRDEAARLRSLAALVYPPLYDPKIALTYDMVDMLRAVRGGESMAILESPRDARRNVQRWMESFAKGRRLITITLRHYDFMPDRNSNSEAWAAFAKSLDDKRYAVMFIPDTGQTLTPAPEVLRDAHIVPEAAWNVGLRMAFYEAAFLNLGISGGPLMLGFFNPAIRCVMFKILNEAVPQSTEAILRERGFEIGRDPSFFSPFQHWVWEDDRLDVIDRETRAMIAKIEASGLS